MGAGTRLVVILDNSPTHTRTPRQKRNKINMPPTGGSSFAGVEAAAGGCVLQARAHVGRGAVFCVYQVTINIARYFLVIERALFGCCMTGFWRLGEGRRGWGFLLLATGERRQEVVVNSCVGDSGTSGLIGWLVGMVIGWMIWLADWFDWFAGYMVGWLIDWLCVLSGWYVGCLAGWLVDWWIWFGWLVSSLVRWVIDLMRDFSERLVDWLVDFGEWFGWLSVCFCLTRAVGRRDCSCSLFFLSHPTVGFWLLFFFLALELNIFLLSQHKTVSHSVCVFPLRAFLCVSEQIKPCLFLLLSLFYVPPPASPRNMSLGNVPLNY